MCLLMSATDVAADMVGQVGTYLGPRGPFSYCHVYSLYWAKWLIVIRLFFVTDLNFRSSAVFQSFVTVVQMII
jgi:hypothetical protein